MILSIEIIKIEIELNEQSKIYNEFNNNQLSDELSNYIYKISSEQLADKIKELHPEKSVRYIESFEGIAEDTWWKRGKSKMYLALISLALAIIIIQYPT